MTTLAQTTTVVKPHVTVTCDGQVFRWQRFDGRTRRSSSEAFTTLADAISTAVSVAQCYGVPAIVPSCPKCGAALFGDGSCARGCR